jgi:hypothetical protein
MKSELTPFPEGRVNPRVLDRLLLVAIGFLMFFLGVGLIFVLRGSLRLSFEWTLFLLATLVYILITAYLALLQPAFRYHKKEALLTLGGVVLIEGLCAFGLFFFGLLPLPSRVIVCTIPSILLAPASIILSERILIRRQHRADV